MSVLNQGFKTIGSVFVLPCGSKTFSLHLSRFYSTFDKHTMKAEVNRSIFKIPLII